jgi:hypothetical protein
VVFTDHAAERASRYGLAYRDIADAILERHEQRRTNTGAGDRLVRQANLVVVHDWPDDADETTARVITTWFAG